MADRSILEPSPGTTARPALLTMNKGGALAALLLAVTLVVPELIYLMGNLSEANGPLIYGLADLLYGPVKALCLVVVVNVLRDRFGDQLPRRMSLGQLIAVLAAAMFVATALLRATNRQYHLLHPELHLENDQTVLIVWATLVGGVIATAWHLLGWSLLLFGSAGWTSGRLPRAWSVLACLVGSAALVVYLVPEAEGFAILGGAAMCLWLVRLLWQWE